MNSKIITCKNKTSYTEAVVSCPADCALFPPFLSLSPPMRLPGLRCPSSLLTLALLPLPFTLLCETYFLPNHALVFRIVYFLKIFPFSREFCGHPVSLLLDHQL